MDGMTFAYLAERASHHHPIRRKSQMSKCAYLQSTSRGCVPQRPAGHWLLERAAAGWSGGTEYQT